MVVPVDVVAELDRERLDAGVFVVVEHLFLQVSEEVFHDGVVQAVALARHGLGHAGVAEEFLPAGVLVLESLVRMHHRGFARGQGADRLAERLVGERGGRRLGDRVGDDRAVEQVQHRREIDLAVRDLELGHVGHPLEVRRLGRELALQQVFGDLADLALVGGVPAAAADLADQVLLSHQLQHGLLCHLPPAAQQFGMDATVPVPAHGLGEDLVDLCAEFRVPVRVLERGLAVEERGAGKSCRCQEQGQRVGGLEGYHGADFQRGGWFLKARTFFR